jgi:hypothetical protein
MHEEIIITPKSESTPAPATPENQPASLPRVQLANLCALGLGVSFFLPWAHILFVNPSGFDLQKDGGGQLLLWLIPTFCVITILAGFAKASQHIAARITGLLPFLVGIYWFYKIRGDLFHILAYGAYLSLIFGTALFVLSRKSK